MEWYRRGKTAFLHFTVNTFTDREWGDGTESPMDFAPTALDCRQWARVLKEAGFTAAILTAKHHDGFCLWDSAYTEHCVRNSPFPASLSFSKTEEKSTSAMPPYWFAR